jgi:GH24 family phage-related lysozyme (muramidase)
MVVERGATAQILHSATPAQAPQAQSFDSPAARLTPKTASAVDGDPSGGLIAHPVLFDLTDSDIKFSMESLMNILRDRRHEGWVLAAYPDPKTSRPLIGAGFSLDVMAAEHLQSDPLNPHNFLEPSSAQLWQAAGLDLDRLQRILDQFDHDMKTWGKKNFRRKIRTHTLQPELTEDEANALLRISAMQAVYNARAYCHGFDQLTGSQQLALSQLVYQMGVNLGEFDQFLSTINREITARNLSQTGERIDENEYWKTVQRTLIESQWARRYRIRAASVIAMFDPDYVRDPSGAERRVQAILRPSRKHSHKRHAAGSLRAANDHIPKMPSGKAGEYQSQRKLS